MGGRLLYRDSQGRDGAVDLNPNDTLFIGRALECAIRTDDGMVSRKHSQVRMENGRFVIEDLGSANGTLINNNRIQKQQLNHNDVVQCGSMWIRYVEDGPLIPPHQAVPPMPASPPPMPAMPAMPGGGLGGMGSPPPMPGSFGAPPGMPGGGVPPSTLASSGGAPAMPFGAPPGMPGGGGAPAMPGMGGGPP
ncbi:MAG TPA: FHA domain-containing protein, partial [Kofleriaceae bacterium]|nr:FHA domain-containing protein [Kofleriaceae bacterium]